MTRAHWPWPGTVLIALVLMRSVSAQDLMIFPAESRLDGPGSTQRLVVERMDGGVVVADETGQARFEISDPGVASVSSDGTLAAVGDGMTVVTARLGERTARASVVVQGTGRAPSWSFRNQVLPIMTKAGCNMGACHGAAAGKNGFRLTLRGYAPELDYETLTRQAAARRIHKTRPHESLVLLKATGAIPHGGGTRFSPESVEYRILADWIANGMTGPSEDDPRVVSIEAIPPAIAFQPGQEQQIVVRATYSDGRVADVTRWAKFESTDIGVVKVDEQGRLRVEGHGEAAVTVWFSSLVALTRVTSKYATAVSPEVFAQAPRNNPIDELNLRKLDALGIPPSPPADDATFLRRAYLDATGTLPPAEEVDAFLAEPDPEKRARLIEKLLASEAFVDYWSYKWSDLLLVSSRNLPKPAMWAFYRYIRQSVEENRPWNEFARRILTARGSTLEEGAGNYFVIHRDPLELTENTSVAFLGLSLTCARCHNHPMEKWTQDQYYGFANLFGRVKLKDGDREGEVEVLASSEGEVLHPRRNLAMNPQPLDGQAVRLDDPSDRRGKLAEWLEASENPYFARAIVNRVWANFFGRGLVDPEDDLRATNPPSDPALMDWLVADLREHRFDLKHLMRLILNSAAYQRSSEPIAGNEQDGKFLSHYQVKRLPAEVLLDAIASVTGVPDQFSGYPTGWRAMQLPDSEAASGFLDAFGRPARESTCSCERSDEPSLAQALHLANGETLNEKLRKDDGQVARLAASEEGLDQVLDRLFRSALSRPPKAEERARIVPVLQQSIEAAKTPEERVMARRQAIEDLYWATLTSPEFLFSH